MIEEQYSFRLQGDLRRACNNIVQYQTIKLRTLSQKLDRPEEALEGVVIKELKSCF